MNYEAKMSLIYSSMLWVIGHMRLESPNFSSQFHRFYSQMPYGGDQVEYFMNFLEEQERGGAGTTLFTTFFPQVEGESFRINVRNFIPVTVREDEVRKLFTNETQAAQMLSRSLSNAVYSLERATNNRIKQRLFDAYNSGVLTAYAINDPLDPNDTEGLNIMDWAVGMNVKHDEYMLEPSWVDVPFNNKVLNPPSPLLETVATTRPTMLFFNSIKRPTMYKDALRLRMGETFINGDSNQDLFRNFIELNATMFPNTANPDNQALDIKRGYQGTPLVKDWKTGESVDPSQINRVLSFVLGGTGDWATIKVVFQMQMTLNWLNIFSLDNQNAIHYDQIVDINPFLQSCVFVCYNLPEETSQTSEVLTPVGFDEFGTPYMVEDGEIKVSPITLERRKTIEQNKHKTDIYIKEVIGKLEKEKPNEEKSKEEIKRQIEELQKLLG